MRVCDTHTLCMRFTTSGGVGCGLRGKGLALGAKWGGSQGGKYVGVLEGFSGRRANPGLPQGSPQTVGAKKGGSSVASMVSRQGFMVSRQGFMVGWQGFQSGTAAAQAMALELGG